MSNPFYNPSGNPATGSEGLSALMRGEFISIGAAFDVMPRITTTGLFDTVFNQLGNFTFTLPGVPGTLATTANVATETTRATVAEGVNATAITAETTARTAAVTAEATARTTAIATETTRATTAEGANAAAITAETTARTTAVTAEATARAAAVTAETTRATTAEGVNAAAIATETTRATAAEALPFNLRGFRNRLINGDMSIWQRGTTLTPTGFVYTADQWISSADGAATTSVSKTTAVDAGVLAAGINSVMLYGVSGTLTGGTFRQLLNRIEDPRTFAGRTVRLSFWATANPVATIVGSFATSAGTGGSPSGSANLGGGTFNLTTSWQRFTTTVALPAASTITPGTNGDGFLEVVFGFPLNTALNVALTGVQVEIDTGVATAFEARPLAVELALAQRYYQRVQMFLQSYDIAGNVKGVATAFAVTPRTSPTVTVAGDVSGNVTSLTLSANTAGVIAQATQVATGSSFISTIVSASAEL